MKRIYFRIQCLSLLAFLFLLAVACKKDERIVYPISFKTAKITVKSDTRKYTASGVEPLTAEEQAMVGNMPIFGLDDALVVGETYLTLVGEGAAHFAGAFGGDFSVQREGDFWTFTSAQDVIIPTLSARDIHGLISGIPKYRNEPIHRPLPEAFDTHITKEIRVATGNLTGIRIPIVAFYLIRRFGNGFTSAFNYLHNEFDGTVMADLRDDDTLFIREYELRLTAR